MNDSETVRRTLADAHAEALRVGDSPLRADRLADRIATLAAAVPGAGFDEDVTARIGSSLADAERVLRRDDDGREAARHLQNAIRMAGPAAPRRPSPFLDD